MDQSSYAEHAFLVLNSSGWNGKRLCGRNVFREQPGGRQTRWFAFALVMLAFCVGESWGATTAVDALEKMRVAELKSILAKRGLSCDGCTEKRAYVDMVLETGGLESKGRGGFRRRNPNNYELPVDDFRIDLWATLAPVVATLWGPLMTFVISNPLLAAVVFVLSLLCILRVAHKSGKHNDIPFKQYLRFQARLQYKHALRLGNRVLVELRSIRSHSVSLGCWLWKRMQFVSVWQLAKTLAVLSLWVLAARVGFGAVFTLLLGFATVFLNLGKRADGQQSAYTIFNNFQALEGELRMEQVEAEMRHMPVRRQNPRENLELLDTSSETSSQVVKAGRNDKVDIVNAAGEKREVKVKRLQEYLDRGWTQVEAVRYEGIIYRGKVGEGGEWSDAE